jgi:archaellum component FlaC
MKIDTDEISSKSLYTMNTLNKIDSKIEDIQKKIKEINQVYLQYEFNKSLKLEHPNSYLKFQVDFLFNEINYFRNIKKYLIKKFVEELYGISDNIILILISLENLDIRL